MRSYPECPEDSPQCVGVEWTCDTDDSLGGATMQYCDASDIDDLTTPLGEDEILIDGTQATTNIDPLSGCFTSVIAPIQNYIDQQGTPPWNWPVKKVRYRHIHLKKWRGKRLFTEV